MAERVDFSEWAAIPVIVATPDNQEAHIAVDFSPVLRQRIRDWLAAYHPALDAQEEPDWDGLFEMAAEASGIAEERLRTFGKIWTVKLLDFLFQKLREWANRLPAATPSSETPSESPTPSKGRSKSKR